MTHRSGDAAIRPETMLPDLLSRLTAREKEVFLQILEAKTAKEIARDLSITKRTVEAHTERVRNKLLARSVVDILRISAAAERMGLFSYEELRSQYPISASG